jgi:hypothetical protein
MQYWSVKRRVIMGHLFCAGRGMTQGGPLSAKLFNILVDAVAREWVQQLRKESKLEEAVITELMAAFFAIFYVDNAYLASRCDTQNSFNRHWTSLSTSSYMLALRPT